MTELSLSENLTKIRRMAAAFPEMQARKQYVELFKALDEVRQAANLAGFAINDIQRERNALCE